MVGPRSLGAQDKRLRLWDLASGKELRMFDGHSDWVRSVAIAPDGRTALSGSADCTSKLWDLASGKVLRTFPGHSAQVTSVAFAPDGRTALSGSMDAMLKIWDLASGKELRNFFRNPGPVSGIAIGPQARTILFGTGSRGVVRSDLASGEELCTLEGHSDTVLGVAIAPDCRTALTGSLDRTLKLWDLTSGKELRTFAEHSDGVSSVAIAPDGGIVLSGSYDKTLKVWDFTRGVAQRAFETRMTAAQTRLQQAPGDASALAILGEWYAFRGMDHWAVEFLNQARERGAAVAPLTLARCYWNLNRNGDARREFQIALEQSTDPAERTYLDWCIEAIDTEPERKRQHEAIAADLDRSRRAGNAIALAQDGKYAEAVAEAAELNKTQNWDSGQWYNFACVYSLASAKIAGKKKEYADRAMELLQKAVNAGWNNARHTATDTDLDPLRDREDFKKLLVDITTNKTAKTGTEP